MCDATTLPASGGFDDMVSYLSLYGQLNLDSVGLGMRENINCNLHRVLFINRPINRMFNDTRSEPEYAVRDVRPPACQPQPSMAEQWHVGNDSLMVVVGWLVAKDCSTLQST